MMEDIKITDLLKHCYYAYCSYSFADIADLIEEAYRMGRRDERKENPWNNYDPVEHDFARLNQMITVFNHENAQKR